MKTDEDYNFYFRQLLHDLTNFALTENRLFGKHTLVMIEHSVERLRALFEQQVPFSPCLPEDVSINLQVEALRIFSHCSHRDTTQPRVQVGN